MPDNPQPVIILVEPQLGANIGMCARAMLNCGWSRLRLVNPRDGWPQEDARAAAADADAVLEGVEVFDSVDDAIRDCRRVFATTARSRSLAQPVASAEEAATEIACLASDQAEVAILFGPEASGLDGQSIARADTLVRFPTNPEFPSLNLAQAVLLFGWEWRRAVGQTREVEETESTASRESLERFLGRLFESLERKDYFLTEDLRPHTEKSLRGLFTRTKATEREVQLLQGLLTALARDKPSTEEG